MTQGQIAMSLLRSIAIGALLTTAVGANASAATIFDNSSLGINNLEAGSATTNGALAESFMTDGATSITLNSVAVDLKRTGGSAGSGSVVVTLNTDVSGLPGAQVASLGTILDSTLSLSTAAFKLISGLSVSLASNTEYFIVLTDSNPAGPNNTKALWGVANGSGGTGTASQIGLFSSASSSQFDSTTLNPYLMTLADTESGAPAPEPATLALLGVGIAGIGWARSRRGARKA